MTAAYDAGGERRPRSHDLGLVNRPRNNVDCYVIQREGRLDPLGQNVMTGEKIQSGRDRGVRSFYRIGPDTRVGTAPGLRLENETALKQGRPLLGALGPGFPIFSEVPRFVFDKKLGRRPRDLEQYERYWLVSDRMRAVLAENDPDGVSFLKCEIRQADGSSGPAHWLCDIMRVLDAVDEVRSRLKIYHDDDERHTKTYDLLVTDGASLVFKDEVVGSAHIFRMAYLDAEIVCDRALKNACKAVGLTGIRFRDARKP